jgi:hypothetical protein
MVPTRVLLLERENCVIMSFSKYFYYDLITDDHIGGECSMHVKNKYSYVQNLFVNPEGRRPFGRSKLRWKDIIKT